MQLSDINLIDRDRYVSRVPFEMFDTLRREAPIFWHEQDEPGGRGFWAVTNYQGVVEVNREIDRFSSARGSALITELAEEDLAQQRMMMLNMDPPMHTRYRLLVNKGFTPRMVSKLEEQMRERCARIIDAVAEKGECDFVTEVAAELPLQVIADVMGVPQEDRHKVFDWSNRMIGSEDPEYQVAVDAPQQAAMELFTYAHELAAEKRINAHDDVFSVLTHVEIDGDKLSELELDMFFMLLAVAGNETTRNLIAHGMLALIEHPEQMQKLREDRSLMPSAVDEMLRWGTPVMHFRRTATRETEIGGQSIKENDKVVIWYISANRDDSVFSDPYTFDITRTPNEHVAFGGGGPHFCLGSNLARLEIRVMFDAVLDRLDDIELSDEPKRLRSNFINGIKHLPIKFSAKS
jgi:cholest-4-en-3-one 26-monooxygenase